MNPLINNLKGEQLMNQLTVIDQETYRNQRLSFTAKTLEERTYHQKEVTRLKRKRRSTINLNKKKIREDLVDVYYQVLNGADRVVMEKTFTTFLTNQVNEGWLTKAEKHQFEMDLITIFNTRKTRERYGIQWINYWTPCKQGSWWFWRSNMLPMITIVPFVS